MNFDDDYLDQDELTKITNIFCAEIDKPNNPQRRVMDDHKVYSKTKESLRKKNRTQSENQRASTTIDEGMIKNSAIEKIDHC